MSTSDSHVLDRFPATKFISQGQEVSFDQVVLIHCHIPNYATTKRNEEAYFIAKTKSGKPVLFQTRDGQRSNRMNLGSINVNQDNKLMIALLQFATGKKIICKSIHVDFSSTVKQTSFETED